MIQSLISVAECVLVDEPDAYLLFLQDMFPYLDKYLVMDYLPKLMERISYTIEKHGLNSICDRALLLDYKAELFVIRKDYGNALKKRLKALELLHSIQLAEMDAKTAALLSNLHNNISNVYLFLKKRSCACWRLNRKSLLLWALTVITAKLAIGIYIICIAGGIRGRRRWNIKRNY